MSFNQFPNAKDYLAYKWTSYFENVRKIHKIKCGITDFSFSNLMNAKYQNMLACEHSDMLW